MGRIGGNPGNKGGSGNPGYGLNLKIGALKADLIEAIMEDCKKFPARRLFWAEKFVNRLMPQEVQGDGAQVLVVQLTPTKYGEIIKREANDIIAGTVVIDQTSSQEQTN